MISPSARRGFLNPGEPLATGKRRFPLLATPHLPHGWDAGMLFEKTESPLFCSDLLSQTGECAALTTRSIVEPARQALIEGQAGPFAHALPYTGETDRLVETLADLGPRTLAVMHGSSHAGDGAIALREFSQALRELLGPKGSGR